MTTEQYQSLINEWNRWDFLERAVQAIRLDAISEQVRMTRKQFEQNDVAGGEGKPAEGIRCGEGELAIDVQGVAGGLAGDVSTL